MQSKHKANQYPCDQCEFSANTLHLIRMHQKSEHLDLKTVHLNPSNSVNFSKYVSYPRGVIYHSCDFCDFSTNEASSLRVHKKSHSASSTCDQQSSSRSRQKRNISETVESICDINDKAENQRKKCKQVELGNIDHKFVHFMVKPEELTDNQNEDKGKDEEYLQQNEEIKNVISLNKTVMNTKSDITGYSCGQCEFTAAVAKNLRQHKEAIHDGIR